MGSGIEHKIAKGVGDLITGVVIVGAIGGILVVGGIGAATYAIFGHGASKKEIAQSYQKGITQGRTEATSNLVSAVNTLTTRSIDNLFLRVNGIANNGALTLEQKEAYLSSAHDTVSQIGTVNRDFSENAERYATGEKPSTNQNFQIQGYEIKVKDFY